LRGVLQQMSLLIFIYSILFVTCCYGSCRWDRTMSPNCGLQRTHCRPLYDIWARSPGGILLTMENWRTGTEHVTLSTTNPTWTDRSANPGLRVIPHLLIRLLNFETNTSNRKERSPWQHKVILPSATQETQDHTLYRVLYLHVHKGYIIIIIIYIQNTGRNLQETQLSDTCYNNKCKWSLLFCL
jgi:hypothetical protein